MNKVLIYKEIKRNRKNLITWSLIVIAFSAMIIGMFPSMADMGQDMSKLMDKLPPELSKAMGMDSNTWTNVLGFYSTYYGIYIILLIGIFTMSTGATIISKEERDGTSEFLFTKPLTRKEIFISKIYSLIALSSLIFLFQTITVILLLLLIADDVNWTALGVMHIHGFALLMFFTFTGVLISFFFQPKKNFMGMVVGIIFGSYFLSAISKSTESLEWIGYISPFHYLDFTPLDPEYSINWIGVSSFILIGIILLIIANKLFNKKDISG